MYAGRIVETAAVTQMFERPAHPYTEALMSCLPDPAHFSRRLTTIPGQAAKPGQVKQGCEFAPRCRKAAEICVADAVPYSQLSHDHSALCRFPLAEPRP